MAKEPPIQAVKRIYGGKDKLIEAIADQVKQDGESKDEAITRLKSVSNKKLMRMGEVAKAVADRGGRDKVVEALGNALGRAKDSDYLEKLKSFSSGKLIDMLGAAEKRAKRAN